MNPIQLTFDKARRTVSVLRNGNVKTSGLDIRDSGTELHISAINSRSQLATGFIAIPKCPDLLAELVRELRGLAQSVEDARDAEQGRAGRAQWVEAAQNMPSCAEGEVEVDSDALVSSGEDAGAYVQGWVWVPLSEAIDTASSTLAWQSREDARKALAQDPSGHLYECAVAAINSEEGQAGEDIKVTVWAKDGEQAVASALALVRASVPLAADYDFQPIGEPLRLSITEPDERREVSA